MTMWSDWFADPVPAFVLGGVVALYVIGARRAHRRRGIGWFTAAMVVLAIAIVSPLDAMSDELFSAHMTQHVLLAVIVPPLLVLAAPERVSIWALPLVARRAIARATAVRRALRAVWRAMTRPLIAWLAHALAIWAWHAPRLYELALRSDLAHALEHVSFVGTGVLLWWRIIRVRGDRRAAYGTGIITIFATAMHTGVLGALFTFSRHVLYPVQAAGAARWGMTALQDQQLAGLIMWVPGGLLYVVAVGALFVAWLDSSRTRRVLRTVVAVGAGAAIAGCARADENPVTGGDPGRGRQAIAASGCGACHDVRGVNDAHGKVGPPLTGVASRSIIGGVLPNTPENMMRWIEDPPAYAPNTAMPNLGIAPQSARDIVAYLYTLR